MMAGGGTPALMALKCAAYVGYWTLAITYHGHRCNNSTNHDGNLQPSDRLELDNADLTTAVRSVLSLCTSIAEQTRRIEQQLAGVEQEQYRITEVVKEVDSSCPLKMDTTKLLCLPLTRDPDSSDIQQCHVIPLANMY